MKEIDQSFISLLHITSIVFLLASVISGGFVIVDNFGIGMLLILLGVLGAILLFSIAKIIGAFKQNYSSTYEEESLSEQAVIVETDEDEESEVEIEEETDEENKEEKIKWYLSIEERRTILSYYRSKGQNIDEIIETPFPKYSIVRAKNFVDVLYLKGEKLRVLTKEDVNAHPNLKKWIEEKIFTKAAKEKTTKEAKKPLA